MKSLSMILIEFSFSSSSKRDEVRGEYFEGALCTTGYKKISKNKMRYLDTWTFRFELDFGVGFVMNAPCSF